LTLSKDAKIYYVLTIIFILQECIYYLQEGDEICYSILSTPLKKEK